MTSSQLKRYVGDCDVIFADAISVEPTEFGDGVICDDIVEDSEIWLSVAESFKIYLYRAKDIL